MANPSTVGEDFTVNGVSLSTYAYNVWTLAGREQVPPVVGDNTGVPYKNGTFWVPKSFGQRMITLGMWVNGCDVNGHFAPTRTGRRAQFNSNLRALKRLFAPRTTPIVSGTIYVDSPPLTLTRTLQFATGPETHTARGDAYNPSSGGLSAGGGGMGTDQWDLTPVTIDYGTFSIDIVMHDPWWYGAQQSLTISVSVSPNGVITNPGDVFNDHPVITMTGPLTNPRLSNSLAQAPIGGAPYVQLWYNGTIAAGTTVTIDCGAFTAFDQAGNSVIGNIAHTGSYFWMMLLPGVNNMAVDNQAGGSVGTGSVGITYSPAYT